MSKHLTIDANPITRESDTEIWARWSRDRGARQVQRQVNAANEAAATAESGGGQ